MQAAPVAPRPRNLQEDIFYASLSASGAKDCDRARAARLGRSFSARFGARIAALRLVHEARYGPDPDFIVTTDCRRGPGAGSPSAMRAFDARLRRLERDYLTAPRGLITSPGGNP